MSDDSKLKRLIAAYFATVSSITDMIFKPLEKFFEPISESVSETFRIISRISTNFLALLPLFVLSIGIGVYFFGTGEFIGRAADVNPISMVAVMLLFASLLSFATMSNAGQSRTESFYISGMLVIAAMSLMLFETPESYAILFGVFYGVGGYISSQINKKNPLPHYHIYDNLRPQTAIKRTSIIGIVAVLLIYGIVQYTAQGGISENQLHLLGILLPAVGFAISSIQFSSYEEVYEHVDLNRSSRLWVFIPRLLVILGIALTISTMNIGAVELVLFLSPELFGIGFVYYMNTQIKTVLGQKTFTDSENYADPLRITGEETVDIESNIDMNDETATLNMNLEFGISEDIPDNKEDPWFQAVALSRKLEDSLNTLERVDESKVNEVQSFKQEALEVAIDRYHNGDIVWEDIPESIQGDVIAVRAENGKLDLQDIHDLDIRFSENLEKDSAKKYADKY